MSEYVVGESEGGWNPLKHKNTVNSATQKLRQILQKNISTYLYVTRKNYVPKNISSFKTYFANAKLLKYQAFGLSLVYFSISKWHSWDGWDSHRKNIKNNLHLI